MKYNRELDNNGYHTWDAYEKADHLMTGLDDESHTDISTRHLAYEGSWLAAATRIGLFGRGSHGPLRVYKFGTSHGGDTHWFAQFDDFDDLDLPDYYKWVPDGPMFRGKVQEIRHVEKACKALLLRSGLITPKEAKAIEAHFSCDAEGSPDADKSHDSHLAREKADQELQEKDPAAWEAKQRAERNRIRAVRAAREEAVKEAGA